MNFFGSDGVDVWASFLSFALVPFSNTLTERSRCVFNSIFKADTRVDERLKPGIMR